LIEPPLSRKIFVAPPIGDGDENTSSTEVIGVPGKGADPICRDHLEKGCGIYF
jgi:hypothetical protein